MCKRRRARAGPPTAECLRGLWKSTLEIENINYYNTAADTCFEGDMCCNYLKRNAPLFCLAVVK